MNTLFKHAAAAALALLAASNAWAGAKVTFVHPDQFSDVPFSSSDRDDVLRALEQHIDKLAAKLPAGQQLNVEVTDVDLAGQTWPSRFRGQDIRIMNGRADWPHMTLRYTLTQGDQVVRSGDETISDMTYQMHINRYGRDDPLRYEKRMLDDWFKDKVATPAMASR